MLSNADASRELGDRIIHATGVRAAGATLPFYSVSIDEETISESVKNHLFQKGTWVKENVVYIVCVWMRTCICSCLNMR